jgi:thiol-disulfide isomerase/thioredoxin
MAKFINLNSGSGGMSLPLGNENTTSLFSKIKIAGSRMSSTTWIILAAIIIFIIFAVVYYYYYIAPKIKASYKPNSEQVTDGSSSSQGEAELLFFYADWCPHCKAAKPIWNDLKAEYQNKTINGYQVIFTEVDCSTETPEVEKMMNQYNVEGYPTIKLLKDGQVIEYDAKPSKETLTQFLNTVL